MEFNQHLIFKVSRTAFLIMLMSCSAKKEEAPVTEAKVNQQNANTVDLTESQFRAADITLGKIELKTLSGVLKVNGKLDVPPQNMVSIVAPFGGFLQSTDLLQGQYIKKGQSLAVMRNPEYIQLQQDYLDNKSQLEFLETEYKRQDELSKENVNAQKSLQQAKSSYFSKVAIVNGLHAKLKLLNIDFTSLEKGDISSTIFMYSPIAGYVTEVNFNIGSFVNPTDILFKIVDTSHLHAELTVFEKDVVKIKKGQKVRFNLAGNGTEMLATVYLIGREILPDRTVRIHSHLDEEDMDLLPGMYLTAIIELGSNPVDALPEKAVVDYGGDAYVFISEKDPQNNKSIYKFKMIKVQKGINELGYTAVLLPQEFKKESTEVVIDGAYSLLSKMKNEEESQ